MPFYKNVSNHPISFFGTTVQPNTVEEIPQYVNNVNLIEVPEPDTTSVPDGQKKRTRRKKDTVLEQETEEKESLDELAADIAVTNGTEE